MALSHRSGLCPTSGFDRLQPLDPGITSLAFVRARYFSLPEILIVLSVNKESERGSLGHCFEAAR
jgi:hypothetical protein